MKKLFLLLILSIFAIGQMWAASEKYTFTSGTTIYIDSRNFSDEIRIPKTNSKGTDSNHKNGGQVYSVTFTADVEWKSSDDYILRTYPNGNEKKLRFHKTGFVENTTNCLLIASDGESFSWTTYTPASYDIIYPASPAHYTLASGYPTSGQTGASISFTATPDAGYELAVNMNGTALTGDNNVYTFSMPDADATIVIIANPPRSFDGATSLYLNASAVSWWCDASALQKATFKKIDDSNIVVDGIFIEEKDGKKIYGYTPEAGQYKSVKFSRHNPEGGAQWNATGEITLYGTDAYNYVLTFAKDSKTVTWDNYTAPVPSADPAIAFVNLPEYVAYGAFLTLEDYVSVENVENASLSFYITKNSNPYSSIASPYTFNEAGEYPITYTLKAEVDGDNLSDAISVEQDITVYQEYTLYFVNKPNWSNPVAYMWIKDSNPTVKNANWPGDAMSLTNSKTEKHEYEVYGYTTYRGFYNRIIFSNNGSNQTGDITIDNSKPYYYDGTWYATLAECDPAQSVNFVNLPSNITAGTNITFEALANGVTNPVYTFYVKKDDAAYNEASSYLFDDEGDYTVKVEVTGDNLSSPLVIEQGVYVNPAITLYFVNHDEWTNIHAYLWLNSNTSIKNANWPGEAMTLTAGTTITNNYPVYSYTFAEGIYDRIIFNNGGSGKQTSDLSFDAATPYYYNGDWYASLDECDVPNLNTEFYLVGSIMGWSSTDYRFVKATLDATEASTTVSINEYSNITFKLKEAGEWRGGNNNPEITKDANTVTIKNGNGDNIRLIPYAAGDYVFTLKLDDSRLLTVTYPDGEQMPVPVNIYASGDFNNWAPSSSDYKFTAVGDVATLTLHGLEANHDYEFKLIDNGTWLGADYVIKYHYNWEIQFGENTPNAVLKTFKGGDYILSYNLTSGLLTVTYPTEGLETKQVEIQSLADGYATFYSNKGWDYPSEVEAYYVSGVDDNGSLTMVPLLGYIPAWVPVILHATPDTYTFYECDDETWIDGNMLKGTIDDEVIDNQHTHYIMTLSNNAPGLYWPYGTVAGVGAFENKGGKAYLEVPATMSVPSQVSARRGFPFNYRTPTAIENIESQAENAKLIRNGQLLILREGKIYNAQGVRVQ